MKLHRLFTVGAAAAAALLGLSTAAGAAPFGPSGHGAVVGHAVAASAARDTGMPDSLRALAA